MRWDKMGFYDNENPFERAIKPTSPPKAHQWVTLSKDALSLMPLLDVDIEMLVGDKPTNTSDDFINGEIYTLTISPVEGVSFSNVYFKLCGVINEYKGITINSLVMIEVCPDENGNLIEGVNTTGRRKFSIPPSMCKMLGFKYRPGLELWPIDSGFKRVNLTNYADDMKDIVYEDMSTYPASSIDGTIRKIILELHGFSSYNNSHIITPTGAMLPTDKFTSSLTVFARQNISTDNGCAGFMINEILPFKIVTRDIADKLPLICDDKHNIYLEVILTKKSLNVNTPDGVIGVAHTALDGKDVDDIIGVKWDEYFDENKDSNGYQSSMHNPSYNDPFSTIPTVNPTVVFSKLNKHFSNLEWVLSNIAKNIE
jgi:hypothetical protein